MYTYIYIIIIIVLLAISIFAFLKPNCPTCPAEKVCPTCPPEKICPTDLRFGIKVNYKSPDIQKLAEKMQSLLDLGHVNGCKLFRPFYETTRGVLKNSLINQSKNADADCKIYKDKINQMISTTYQDFIRDVSRVNPDPKLNNLSTQLIEQSPAMKTIFTELMMHVVDMSCSNGLVNVDKMMQGFDDAFSSLCH